MFLDNNSGRRVEQRPQPGLRVAVVGAPLELLSVDKPEDEASGRGAGVVERSDVRQAPQIQKFALATPPK